MKLSNLLKEEYIATGETLADKDAVLQRIVEIAKKSPILKNVSADEILKGLEDREKLGSTGFGRGVAIPHCRLSSVSNFVVGLIALPDGVDFVSADGEPVYLVVFIIAPDDRPNDHIRLLSGISRELSTPAVVQQVVAKSAAGEILNSLLERTAGAVDSAEGTAKHIFHVLVQKEELLRDILQVFGTIGSGSPVVLTVENASMYLSKMPLFASFWTDSPDTFGRLIIALVGQPMTNEAIRQIELLAGGLGERAGVMLIVQETHYCGGYLDA